MSNLAERITINPERCGGRPCVRGMRIRVTDVLELFAAGLAAEQILKQLPDLEPEDLQACVEFAAQSQQLESAIEGLSGEKKSLTVSFRKAGREELNKSMREVFTQTSMMKRR